MKSKMGDAIKLFDIRDIVRHTREVVSAHAGATPGEYHRVLKPSDDKSVKTGVTAYGCADAACILYTLGKLPTDAAAIESWIEAIGKFQNPQTGLFEDGSHHEIHTTAFALAALDFFDARAAYPLKALHPLRERRQLESFLEQEDPETGFGQKGKTIPLNDPESPVPLFHYLGGSFHYLFNIVHASRKQRHPEKAVDTCLEIWNNRRQPLYGEPFCRGISYAEIDWVFYLNRSVRQCGYRFEESRKAMEEAAEKYIDYLKHLDYSTDAAFNDLHKLFGMICALSEFQLALPGQFITERPLRQVLDRRPYI